MQKRMRGHMPFQSQECITEHFDWDSHFHLHIKVPHDRQETHISFIPLSSACFSFYFWKSVSGAAVELRNFRAVAKDTFM